MNSHAFPGLFNAVFRPERAFAAPEVWSGETCFEMYSIPDLPKKNSIVKCFELKFWRIFLSTNNKKLFYWSYIKGTC